MVRGEIRIDSWEKQDNFEPRPPGSRRRALGLQSQPSLPILYNSGFIILLLARAWRFSMYQARVKYEKIYSAAQPSLTTFHIVNWESNYTHTRGISLPGGPESAHGESAQSEVPRSGHQAGRVSY